MKKIIILTLLLETLISNFAGAQEMPPAVYLNKITQRLVGSWPQPTDYENLQKEMRNKNCTAVSCLEEFFRGYIKEKMNRPEFYALFYAEVTERMGYKSPGSAFLSQIIQGGQDFNDPSTGRDFALTYRTLKENRSFDDLFTSQLITDPVYKTGDVSVRNGNLDLFSIDTSGLSGGGQQSGSYNIELENGQTNAAAEYNLKNHNNVSGLFSTRKFLLKYWTSPINENRKRAAAFFRIMMCDSMSPALERETQKEKENRIAMGRSDEQVIRDDLKAIHVNKHASQKDCAACHDRLDPIGRTFRGLELGVSNEAFRGNLRYFGATNNLVDIPVTQFHDLTVKTTAVPKYLDCQTNWLIETFLGKDLNLPPTRFSEVVTNIEKRKRRLKDVIEDLLMIPEFRGLRAKVVEPPSLVAAKVVLNNCTECHSNTFSLRPEQMKTRLSRVAVCLDLPNNAKDPQMPPSDHWWQPSGQELTAIKNWLQEGAPIGDNVQLFDKSEVNQLMTPNKDTIKCRQ
ncbi:MAG: DUF1588 domain-containing protein [Bdellovibrionaceae bacterium]|nr:DUF1588 domain-containing protein [Bdellovibrio sp.]